MKLEDIKRGMRVTLNIPAARPIKTLNGAYHEAGQVYKVLGSHGTCVRLSREKDWAKLIIPASEITPVCTVDLRDPAVMEKFCNRHA